MPIYQVRHSKYLLMDGLNKLQSMGRIDKGVENFDFKHKCTV